jgi:hypothetical protein
MQQSLICAEKIKQELKQLNDLNCQIETLLNTLAFINASSGRCVEEINDLQEMQKSLNQEYSSLIKELSINTSELSTTIVYSEEELLKKQKTLENLKSLKSKISLYDKKEMEQKLTELRTNTQSNITDIKETITDDIVAVSSFHIETDENDSAKLINISKRLEDNLYSLLLATECPKDIKTEIIEVRATLQKITNIEYLRNFESVTIKPLLKKYDKLLAQQSEQQRLYNELYNQYTAMCAIAQIPVKDFSPDVRNIELLSTEIAILEQAIIMQTEQSYITNCVNEVMAEMGYDLIGNREITKRSGKQFKNELYLYDEGTAINVTYDSQGQIAIELGGIDRTDRLPSIDETDVLCEDMESFCADFIIFEEKLKEKGIVMKSRISMAPATAEYATIINIEDYNLTTTKSISNMKNKNTRKRTGSKKHLQNDGN